ncbi:hypothetical protein ASU32_18735 [Tsukamurella tyrosinosolvens]|nr:hypothetical protein ASU32_18735 [Tsukamurella tyrosinosolvens]
MTSRRERDLIDPIKPFRSRETSISTGPISVISVSLRVPLRKLSAIGSSSSASCFGSTFVDVLRS